MFPYSSTCSWYKVHSTIFIILINESVLYIKKHCVSVRCWVSGWGKDAFGTNGQYQSIMKEVDVPIIDQTICEASLRQTRLGQYFFLNRNSFLCAGGEAGKDACTVSDSNSFFLNLSSICIDSFIALTNTIPQ